jgi:hypothetical protein
LNRVVQLSANSRRKILSFKGIRVLDEQGNNQKTRLKQTFNLKGTRNLFYILSLTGTE